MYGDQRSIEFINGMHSFIGVAEANKQNVLCLVHVVSVRIRRITLPQISFIATFLGPVSCPTIIVGPSTEKEGL
jgi:hypothetical protein